MRSLHSRYENGLSYREWPFIYSLKVNSVSFVITKHFRNRPLLFFFYVTCWSIGWNIGLVLGGKKLIWMKSNSLTNSSSKDGGWAGALSSNRRHFNFYPLFWRYFLSVGVRPSFVHSWNFFDNSSLYICSPHNRQFAFHYIIPLRH